MKTYTLTVATDFSAAHALRDYPGKCARTHGHNYRVQAEIQTHNLDKLGISIDYFKVKQIIKSLAQVLDHYNINTIKPFDTINPTAENIAAWFFDQLNTKLQKQQSPVQLIAVTLWESEDFSVRYSET